MRYTIHVENLTDKTDFFDMEADALMIFVGKFDMGKSELEHGMGFAGSKKIMAEIINTIPYQIKSLMEEERKAQEANHKTEPPKAEIILPHDFKKGVKN
jgi:hypothetical protein